MSDLSQKINEHFAGLVVRKDLVKAVKGNAIVPSYVLEYLLGQYCATSDESSIQSGIETVKEILRKHYVHRNEAGLIRSTIKEKGRYKVIDKISVDLNDKTDCYEATFSNLGIKKVLVDSATIKKHPKLLVGGVWCIVDVEYEHAEDSNVSPWLLNTIKPIQLSHFDFDTYVEARKQFTTDEWIDLLIHSVGFNPELFGKRSKLQQLVRLIPFCERNYNLIELGPKGTGKSHVYSEFSPHGILISGGEVTVAKLFVNNASGKIGLVGYWDTVAFDEFAGKKKKSDKALVDILKNYMANKSFSRGIETLGAEASMVFVGNTQHTLPYMLKHSELFDELPEQFHDSAFLDRLHFYLAGWEMDNIRAEMFSNGYGFVVDYLAEILRSLRNHDYSDKYQEYFQLHSDISTRDRDGIHKTFSGLMKILYPHGEAPKEEVEEILRFAIEGRKRVKDQLMKIDSTYQKVRFGYVDLASGNEVPVYTLEEEQYPQYFSSSVEIEEPEGASADETTVDVAPPVASEKEKLKEGHLTFQENQRGVTFDSLFGPYLKGATKVVITDPYIRLFYQARNLMEFLETIARQKADEDEVEVRLITIMDDFKAEQQVEYFEQIETTCAAVGIHFSWEFDGTNTIHARHIELDNGWKILLDRGLDIFQHYDMNDAFSLTNRVQRYRSCKAFEVTYLKT
ncbi:BREX system Lon protease-like protein BrxL [Mariprofundus ferrooxydans]|uniref:BREX system Lon protease-like protein BrxL n=1 Tax=Mariprofundus ferrooxydans TaxID=314344 RepID=UPI0006A7341F|nr:BREX system Lon protease-like protein BrxL [Mariprofundus ferrooxydans]KON48509.1 ATP-dependent Lon protease [Mariprofundus ferrooxydans]